MLRGSEETHLDKVFIRVLYITNPYFTTKIVNPPFLSGFYINNQPSYFTPKIPSIAIFAMVLEVVEGDLLEAPEQYIVQQSNCATTYAAGLAQAIAEKFPHADVYRPQVRKERNI